MTWANQQCQNEESKRERYITKTKVARPHFKITKKSTETV